MSTFSVKVTRIRAIEPISGADAIELAVVGDYRSVIKKNQFKAGDLAVYIPEAAIVPTALLKQLGLEGRLAGSEKNRVKAIKLRGCLSQGLLVPIDTHLMNEYVLWVPASENTSEQIPVGVYEDQDVAEILGIKKYEPPIPVHMAGEVYNAGIDLLPNYDIENIKRYPDALIDGEEVIITEKLHGTFCMVGIVPENQSNENHYQNRIVVSSKGLGGKGLAFKHNEANAGNLYVRTIKELNLDQKLLSLGNLDQPIFMLGEIFGRGVQDLTYGMDKPTFRCFDVFVGTRSNHVYLGNADLQAFLQKLDIPMVPVLYKGPYSKAVVNTFTNGQETISGGKNIREGVVIKPIEERYVSNLGRLILKSVSEAYLLRKGDATEYN